MEESQNKTYANSPVNKVDKVPMTMIRPARGWASLNLSELWKHRDLLYFFTWRDIKLRYKQTLLGFAWAILQPFLAMIIFSLFFGGLAQISSNDIPYPVFVYSALLSWTLFAESCNRSTASMVANANIIQKVYFPRIALPLSSVMSPLVDFAIAFTILIAMMAYFGIIPTINVIFLPLFVLMASITSLGVGLWLSALNVQYRDFQYVVPFMVQIWMFASPVVYPASLVPESYQLLYGLNPMVGVIEGFRWALFGTPMPGMITIASVFISLTLLVTGLLYFTRVEKTFADTV